MKSHFTSVLCMSVLCSSQASATIVSGAVTGGQAFDQGGTFIKLSVPFTESAPDNTVGGDTFDTPNLYGFDEGQNIDITIDLSVNILADGSGSGTVPGGSTVASHYVFFDPLGLTTQQGTVTFDSEIFGVITSTGDLSASDFLINTGVTYLNPGARGLESNDVVTITGLNTITVDWAAVTPGDYVRVLTDFSPGAVVPIPAAVWLFGSGLVGLLGISKRQKG